MAGHTVRVLMVEDSILDAELVVRDIHKSGLDIVAERVDSLTTLHQALASFDPDIVLSDYSIPGFGGMQALQVLRRERPDIPFIFVSGTIGEERAIEALHHGATDYVLKDNRSRLVSAVKRALQEAAERRARHAAELAKEEAERRFRLFMDHLPAAVFIQDTQRQPVYFNSEFERLATVPGDSRPTHGEVMNSFIDRLLANDETMLDPSRGIVEEIDVAGSQQFFLIQKFPIPSADNSLAPLIGGFALDVTNTYYDSLTGLANRQLFFDRLAQSLNDAQIHPQKSAVILIDIHRFRDVNDMLGRHAGDNVLRLCASRLQTTFSTASKTLAHLEGDRFAVTVNLQDSEINTSIQQWISQLQFLPFIHDGNELHIGLRLGIALFPDDGNAPDLVFRNAEAALQRARRTGQQCVFYSPEMNARIAESLRFESQLHKAVEQKQFQLYYQPKVDVKSRKICGLEALIRWNEPNRGMISPAEFVPLLEQSGLITTVGIWIFEQVMADITRWRSAGFAVPRVAVNVSQVQLQQPDFVEGVLTALGYLPGSEMLLDIEITESLFMQDSDNSIAKLHLLRDAGMRIFMDDFGTGYSSLSQITALPLDALKIDQSFIANMNQDITLVSTIISLANALKIDVVAEGVETEDQAATLTQLGCGQAQGYLISRPIPAFAIDSLLQRED